MSTRLLVPWNEARVMRFKVNAPQLMSYNYFVNPLSLIITGPKLKFQDRAEFLQINEMCRNFSLILHISLDIYA